jgi:hypothetical protein
MPTTIQHLVDQLHGAGLSLTLTPTGGLAVAPSCNLTDGLRGLIRCNKPGLVDWVTDNEARLTVDTRRLEYQLYSKLIPSTPSTPPPTGARKKEPSTDSRDWHELDAAYLVHHVKCKTCIAAGRGIRYGLRCGTGAALWLAYTNAGTTPTPTGRGFTQTPNKDTPT